MSTPRQGTRNPVGWGFVEGAASDAERRAVGQAITTMLGGGPLVLTPPRPAEAIALPPARVEIPNHLAGFVSTAHADRLLRARGRSFRDLVALRGEALAEAPDAVALPADELELCAALEWAERRNLAVIPFGGGSSVVGGVNPEVPAGYGGVLTLDTTRMCRVLEVDATDQLVWAQAGILGPALDDALRPHGLSTRHFPQSYLHSTLGGWVATRSAGHFSTGAVKIEDRVASLDVLLPDGRSASTRPLPAGSVGPDPNRLWAGSEGAFGVITGVRLRVVPIPTFRRLGGMYFARFEDGLAAVRELAQSGLWPSHLRLLDSYEHVVSAMMQGRRARTEAYLIVGFESHVHPVDGRLKAALALAAEHGGRPEAPGPRADGGPESDPAGARAWRHSFFRQPYLRDALLDWSVLSDTFETAISHRGAPALYHGVRQATLAALERACGGGGVLCRTTHAYPDGVALYFSFFGRGRPGGLLDAWREVKGAASDAIIAAGGTISHHHAMGRDHRRWAKQELPAPFRTALAAARRHLDPAGRMNPGLWFDEELVGLGGELAFREPSHPGPEVETEP